MKKNTPGCDCCESIDCLHWRFAPPGRVPLDCGELDHTYIDERWMEEHTWIHCRSADVTRLTASGYGTAMDFVREATNSNTPQIVLDDLPESQEAHGRVSGVVYLEGEGAGISIYCDYEDEDNYHRVHLDISAIDDTWNGSLTIVDNECGANVGWTTGKGALHQLGETYRTRIYKCTSGTETLLNERTYQMRWALDEYFFYGQHSWANTKYYWLYDVPRVVFHFCCDWDGHTVSVSTCHENYNYVFCSNEGYYSEKASGGGLFNLVADSTFHDGRKWGIAQETPDPTTQLFGLFEVSQYSSWLHDEDCNPCFLGCSCYETPDEFEVDISGIQDTYPLFNVWENPCTNCANVDGTYTLTLDNDNTDVGEDGLILLPSRWPGTSGCVWRYRNDGSGGAGQATCDPGNEYIQEIQLWHTGWQQFTLAIHWAQPFGHSEGLAASKEFWHCGVFVTKHVFDIPAKSTPDNGSTKRYADCVSISDLAPIEIEEKKCQLYEGQTPSYGGGCAWPSPCYTGEMEVRLTAV